MLDPATSTRPREPLAGPFAFPARAFSLIELLIVLAILATVSAIAVPRYQLATARYRALGAARLLAAEIEGLRQQALARSLGQRFRVRSASTYQVTDSAAGWGAASVRTVDLAADPYRARFTASDLGADGELVFSGFGVPDGAASFDLACGGVSARVSVDGQTGAVAFKLAGVTGAPDISVDVIEPAPMEVK